MGAVRTLTRLEAQKGQVEVSAFSGMTRSAPATLPSSARGGGTMDRLSEWYLGFSYFFRGNDVKWQLGYVLGESKDTVTGGAAKAQTQGVRSQMQVNV